MIAGAAAGVAVGCRRARARATIAPQRGRRQGLRGPGGIGRMTDSGAPVPFREALAEDILAHVPPELRDVARRGWWVRTTLGVVGRSAGFRLTCLYRLGHLAHRRCGRAGRLLAGGLSWWGRHWYGCALDPRARLGGGLILPHPQGIVIGPGATTGPRAWIYQNVAIVGAPGLAGMPRVGADCRIYTGAVLVGPVAVGDHAILGANVVITRDVPGGATVRRPPPAVVPLPGPGGR